MPRMLVVNDDAVMRQAIALVLEQAGHSVLRCENGRKATEYLAFEDADLLITDMIMPEMDGIETVRVARRLQPELPIIAMSGGEGLNGPRDCLGLARYFGATAVLAKPFQFPELAELVSELLGCAAASRSARSSQVRM